MAKQVLVLLFALFVYGTTATDNVFQYFDMCFQPTATTSTTTSTDTSSSASNSASTPTSTTTEAADNHAWLDNINCQALTSLIGNDELVKIQAALTPVPIVNSEETASERVSENGVTYTAAATTSGPSLTGLSLTADNSVSTTGDATGPLGGMDVTGGLASATANGLTDTTTTTGFMLLQTKVKSKSLHAIRNHIQQRQRSNSQNLVTHRHEHHEESRNPYRKADQLWPNANVYFAYAQDASADGQPLGVTAKARVSQAILEWEAATCLDFIQVDPNDKTNGLLMVSGEHTAGQRLCAPQAGAFPGTNAVTQLWTTEPQTGNAVFPDGCLKGTFLHDLGHVVGLYHTQQRSDASMYVTLVANPAFSTQYDPVPDDSVKDATLLPTPPSGSTTVDATDPSQLARSFYSSIMLYANDNILSINTQTWASAQDSAATSANTAEFTALMGQRQSLGVLDQGSVLAAYGCKAVKIGLTDQDSVTAAWFHPGQTVGQIIRKVRQFYLNLGTVLAPDQVVLFLGAEGSANTRELTPLSALVATFITSDSVVIRHELLQTKMQFKNAVAGTTTEMFVDLSWKVSRVRDHLKFFYNFDTDVLFDGNAQLSDDNTLVSYGIDGSETLSTEATSAISATAAVPVSKSDGTTGPATATTATESTPTATGATGPATSPATTTGPATTTADSSATTASTTGAAIVEYSGQGVDVSQPCGNWQCIKDAGFSFAIPRIYRETNGGTVDPHGAQSVRDAAAVGLSTDVYMYPAATHTTEGVRQAQDVLTAIAGLPVGRVWVDVENQATSWGGNAKPVPQSTTQNRQLFKDIVDTLLAGGARVGVYTQAWQWDGIFGTGYNYASSLSLPVWYAAYGASRQTTISEGFTCPYAGSAQSFAGFTSVGGVTAANMKQYNGDCTLCTCSVDLNWKPALSAAALGTAVGTAADSSAATTTPTAPATGTPTCVDTEIEGKQLCTIGGCTVSRTIGSKFADMMNAATAAGHGMGCSSSFRTMASQVQLRIQNCGGDTHFNVYEKPSSQCSPPTAIPGRSNHEKGLAVDLNCLADPGAKFGTTECFTWMQSNAATFGFANLPSEPWHWSVDGR